MSYQKALTQYHRDAAISAIDYDDAETLRRAALVLHRWAEHECNGVIERAESGRVDHKGRAMIVDACYSVSNINGPGPIRYHRTADRETPARVRAEKIAAKYGAVLEIQGDPRGWPITLKMSDGRNICPPCR